MFTSWVNIHDAMQDLTSDGTAEWNSFDLSGYGQYLTEIEIVIRGTEGTTPGFSMMDFRVLGDDIENPTDTIYVSAANGVGGCQCKATFWLGCV